MLNYIYKFNKYKLPSTLTFPSTPSSSLPFNLTLASDDPRITSCFWTCPCACVPDVSDPSFNSECGSLIRSDLDDVRVRRLSLHAGLGSLMPYMDMLLSLLPYLSLLGSCLTISGHVTMILLSLLLALSVALTLLDS